MGFDHVCASPGSVTMCALGLHVSNLSIIGLLKRYGMWVGLIIIPWEQLCKQEDFPRIFFMGSEF